MADRDLIAGSSSAVEELVRTAMAAGAMCIMEKAAAGEIDPRASLGDALGDFPAEFIKIRAGLVGGVIAELAAQRPPLGYVVGYHSDHGWTFARDYGGPEWMRAAAEQELANEAEQNPGVDFKLIECREVQP